MLESSLLSSFRGKRFKKIWCVFYICLAASNITACDYINSKLYPDFKANEVKTQVDKPPFARQNKPPKISIDKMRDIADSSKTQIDNEAAFNVNPVALKNEIATPKGLKANDLFSAPTENNEERFARLENEVQKISDTLNKMSPAITRLIGIESELDSLTFQLEELIKKGQLDDIVAQKRAANQAFLADVPAPTSTENNPAAQKQGVTPPKQAAQKPPSQTVDNSGKQGLIYKIRLGDHPDKTRIVFETTEKLAYTISIDNEENLMLVTFPNGAMTTDPDKAARQSDLIQAIAQTKKGNGSIIAFDLTQNAQKQKEIRIPPGAELARHRIVIDLKR